MHSVIFSYELHLADGRRDRVTKSERGWPERIHSRQNGRFPQGCPNIQNIEIDLSEGLSNLLETASWHQWWKVLSLQPGQPLPGRCQQGALLKNFKI